MAEPSMIESWIEEVCNTAGWPAPFRNPRGVYRFRLAGQINVDVWAPDHREMIMESVIARLPEQDLGPMLEKTATAVLPRVFKDSGIVALDRNNSTLVLQKRVTLGILRHSQFADVMEMFLNDLNFYRSLCPEA